MYVSHISGFKGSSSLLGKTPRQFLMADSPLRTIASTEARLMIVLIKSMADLLCLTHKSMMYWRPTGFSTTMSIHLGPSSITQHFTVASTSGWDKGLLFRDGNLILCVVFVCGLFDILPRQHFSILSCCAQLM